MVEARRRLDELKDKMRVIKWALEGAGVIVMPCPGKLHTGWAKRVMLIPLVVSIGYHLFEIALK